MWFKAKFNNPLVLKVNLLKLGKIIYQNDIQFGANIRKRNEMAKDLSNNCFRYWLNYSLSWVKFHSMDKAKLVLKEIISELNNDTRCGDLFSIYPEVYAAFWMSILELENDDVFCLVMKKARNYNHNCVTTNFESIIYEKTLFEASNQIGKMDSSLRLNYACTSIYVYADLICGMIYHKENIQANIRELLIDYPRDRAFLMRIMLMCKTSFDWSIFFETMDF